MSVSDQTNRQPQAPISAQDARAIAKEAYIYGFPIVDNYRVLHAYVLDPGHPEYKGPFNRLVNIPRVFTPQDTAVQTPNSDTPYSMVWLDLRAEPLVLTLPAVPAARYFSVQLIDAFTFNFAYLGSRTTGNGGGRYLVAGRAWEGEVPAGIGRVARAETDFVLAVYRTQLFEPADLEAVKRVQAGYAVEPLSAALGRPAPPPAPAPDFPAPLSPAAQRTSLEFFNLLSFGLGYADAHPSEAALRERLARIGVVAGAPFVAAALPPELRGALAAGMADGQAAIEAAGAAAASAADLFGTREFMRGNFLNRAVAAQLGIYGNSKEEAFYVPYERDTDGEPADAARHRYALRFPPGGLPPVHAFWSLTMYDLPGRLLVANPLARYLINSPMLPALQRDADGGLTLSLQHDAPGAAEEANWLPAPRGPFYAVLRCYWPQAAVLDGSWTAPGLQRVA